MERERLSAELGLEDLQSLLDIARLLASRASFEEKMEDVVTELARVTGAREVTIRQRTDDSEGLRRIAVGGPAATEALPPVLLSVGEGLAGRAIQDGQIIVSNDYAHDPQASAAIIARGTRSAVALPIEADGMPVGVLIVASQDPDQFSDQRVRFLSSVVDALSPLLQNARLQESDQLRVEELETLSAVSRALAMPGSYMERVQRVLTEVARASATGDVLLRVPDQQQGGLRLLVRVGAGGEPPGGPEIPNLIPFDAGLAGSAFRTRKHVVSEDAATDSRLTEELRKRALAVGMTTSIALPIQVGDEVIGVLITGSSHPGHFTSRRVRLLSNVADGLGPLLENARLQEDERLHAEETQVLFSLAQTLAEEGSFEEKATRFVGHLAEILQVNSVALRLLDDERVILRLVAAAGSLLEMLPLTPDIGLDLGLSGIAVRERRIVVSNDYASDTRALAGLVAQGVASGLAMPIRVGDDVLGVIVLSARKPDHFTPRRVRLMEAVAGGVGVLLESARLREKEELRAEELQALFAVSGALAATGTFRDRVSDAMRRLSAAFPGGAFTLWLRNEKEDGLQLVASGGPRASTIVAAQTFMPSGSGLPGLAYAEGRVIVSNDYRNDPHAVPDVLGKRVRSAIALPIRVADEVLSVLSVSSLKGDFFTPRRVEVLTAVAEGMGSLIESAHLAGPLQLLAVDISPREREVLDYAAEGLTNQMIAQRLGVTQNTIKFHMKNISSKLNLRSRRDLRRR